MIKIKTPIKEICKKADGQNINVKLQSFEEQKEGVFENEDTVQHQVISKRMLLEESQEPLFQQSRLCKWVK